MHKRIPKTKLEKKRANLFCFIVKLHCKIPFIFEDKIILYDSLLATQHGVLLSNAIQF